MLDVTNQSVKINTDDKHWETCMYIPRSLSFSRELTVLCQYTEFQNQSVKIITEDKHWKRVCIPLSLSVSHELTILCQYTQNQSVKINTEDKHWETCMYTSIRQIEQIGQIDKLQAGSQNIVEYF